MNMLAQGIRHGFNQVLKDMGGTPSKEEKLEDDGYFIMFIRSSIKELKDKRVGTTVAFNEKQITAIKKLIDFDISVVKGEWYYTLSRIKD